MFNLFQPVDSTLAATKAAKDGSDLTNPTTWRKNLSLASRESELSLTPGLVLPGVSGTYAHGAFAGALGTGDFTIFVRMITPAETSGNITRTIFILGPSSASKANGLFAYLYNGSLFLSFLDGAGTSERRVAITGWNTTYAGQIVDLVITRSGTTVAVYVNGVVVSTTNNTLGGSPPADYSATVNSLWLLFAGDGGASTFLGEILDFAIFNRVVNASGIESFGVPWADRWGSQTAQTSGSLVAGMRYRIDTFVAGDSFTAVGAASNASGVEFVATGTAPTWANGSSLRRVGALVALELDGGIGTYVRDLSSNDGHLLGTGTVLHRRPRKSGCFTVIRSLAHSDISSSAATTKLFDLPPNCAVMGVEFDRTVACDAGITLNVGVAGTATKFINAQTVASTGIVRVVGGDLASQSNSANTPVYVQKSGATTVGAVKVRVTVEIRG